MPRCVVLLSGGLDSATAAAVARQQGFDLFVLTVAYGQRHAAEIRAAERLAQVFRAKQHKTFQVSLGDLGGSALLGQGQVPKNRQIENENDIPPTYVPARNTILLGLALAYAEVIDSQDIFVGFNAVDYSGYPDCRPEFVDAFQKVASLATKAAVEGRPTKIHAPLITLTKRQIIELGVSLGVDYSLTLSCYDPDPSGQPCGECDSCRIRAKGFAEAGLADPALQPGGAPR